MAFSDVIARLAVSLSMDTAAFQTGSRKAQRETETLRGKMTTAAKAIGGALAGMVSWQAVQTLRDWTQAAVDSAGGLAEQAAQLGVTTDALQEYRYAATQVGLSSAEMDQGLAQLTRRMGDAAQAGKGPVVEAFKALGLSLDEIKGKTAGDVLPLIAEGMAKVEDPAQRAAIAFDLFGRAGQKLLPLLESGPQGLDNLRQAAHELGIVLSESDIAKADEVADKVAALRYVLEAQQNRKLLENAEALLQYEQSVADLKIGLIEASGTLQSWADEYDAFNARNIAAMAPFRAAFRETFMDLIRLPAEALAAITRLVTGIGQWLGGQLDAIWKRVTDRIAIVKAAFWGLYDAVIGHSYIPDMIDGIAAEMGRLDAVMVQPVRGATDKAKQAFRDLAREGSALLDSLFPELAAQRGLDADEALLRRLGLSPEQLAEANRRLGLRFTTGSPHGGETPRPGWTGDVSGDRIAGGLDSAAEMLNRRFEAMAKKAEDARVRIARSFREMAEDTIGSLNRLSSAIKDGGFLGILESVIGLGLQLGSVGVFGKTIQTRLNASVPRYAGGTNFHPGGLALVGERGPELVSMPRGSRVHSNDNSRGMMGGNTYYFNGNLMTEEFWARIHAGDVGAAQAGGQVAVARIQRHASRRWR